MLQEESLKKEKYQVLSFSGVFLSPEIEIVRGMFFFSSTRFI